MSAMSRVLRGILCGLVCCAVAGTAAAAEEKPPAVFVAEVRAVPFVDRIEALGTLKANESVALTATVAETVSAIHFNDGERVPAGKVLVEMTGAEERALLAEAQATHAEADRQFQRVKSLAEQGTAAKSLLDERRREWQTARARLEAIESRLADRLIKAPFAGVVGLRNLSLGALVAPGDLITTLDDDSVMKLEFAVPSPFLPVLRPGLAIQATARAFGERRFEGEVSAIDSRVDPVTRAVLVRALVPNPERMLKPGLLMQVTLLKNRREALVVPEQALMPLADRQFVLVVDDGNKASRREVRIGARRPGEVEILEGLASGERVVTDGTLKVRDGQTVTVTALDDGRAPLRGQLDNAR